MPVLAHRLHALRGTPRFAPAVALLVAFVFAAAGSHHANASDGARAPWSAAPVATAASFPHATVVASRDAGARAPRHTAPGGHSPAAHSPLTARTLDARAVLGARTIDAPSIPSAVVRGYDATAPPVLLT